MISVAMCTYNGEKYLAEQLDSIVKQTAGIDELVVCDDGSTDGTVQLLFDYAKKTPFEITIHLNKVNLGSTKNFEKCLTFCKGDYILLADQDDIWREDRVEKQLEYLENHPGTDAVFSNAAIIDSHSQKTGRTIWKEVDFLEKKQKKWRSGKAYEILFGDFVATGATMAIRKSCLNRLTPFPTKISQMIHDGWIAMALSLENKIDFIAEPLIFYREHASQQVGFGAKVQAVTIKDRMSRPREEKLAPLEEKRQHLEALFTSLSELPFVDKSKLKMLQKMQRHYKKRSSLPHSRLQRVAPVLSDVVAGKYSFSSKHWWLPALGDILE